jgi:hypothetical protein
MGCYAKLCIATPMHSAQLGIGCEWRVARKPRKLDAARLAWAHRTPHSFVVHIDSVLDVCHHEIVIPYQMPMAKRITLPLAARPANGPMSISALYCKAGNVRAFTARTARNYAKFAASKPCKNRGGLVLLCLVAHYA